MSEYSAGTAKMRDDVTLYIIYLLLITLFIRQSSDSMQPNKMNVHISGGLK